MGWASAAPDLCVSPRTTASQWLKDGQAQNGTVRRVREPSARPANHEWPWEDRSGACRLSER